MGRFVDVYLIKENSRYGGANFNGLESAGVNRFKVCECWSTGAKEKTAADTD
jgi:hypothetical protein